MQQLTDEVAQAGVRDQLRGTRRHGEPTGATPEVDHNKGHEDVRKSRQPGVPGHAQVFVLAYAFAGIIEDPIPDADLDVSTGEAP